MTRTRVLGALLSVGALLLAASLWRQARYTVTLERLRDDFYLLEATGMNVAMLVTDDGVVLVDTMPRGWWGPALLAKIQSVTDKPITTIIHTHSHHDHIGNTALFSATVVDVVVHENAQRDIERSDVAAEVKLPFSSAKTFADTMSLTRGRHPIELRYFGAGHTSGDAWVVFPSLGIMHIGDLVYKDDAPSFDRRAGGSGVTYPETLARGLSATTNVDTVIVGHSYDGQSKPVVSRRDLEQQQRLGARLLSAAREAIQTGRNASEAAAALSTSEGFERFHRDRIEQAIEAIFDELKQ
jgi:glyoxylase-like metal-dependent hydrolase (beta-lactamase superfamily II)